MSAVTFSLDARLVKGLKEVLPLSVFIETGTFKGDTIAAMAPLFDRLITVEFSEPIWREAGKRFENSNNVEVLLGNSPEVLATIRPALGDTSTLFWLDAHWCVATDTAGELSQCPLLEELQAIGRLNSQSVIIIDDARLFLATPPVPHEVSQWPRFDDIIAALRALSDSHALMVVNDFILFYPTRIDDAVKRYAHYFGADWLRVFNIYRDHEYLAIRLKEKEQELASAREKETKIFLLKVDCNAKDEEILSLKKICEERESLIFQLDDRVKFLDRTNIPGKVLLKVWSLLLSALTMVKRSVVLMITPRLGVLRQYSPHLLTLPERYATSVNPSRMPKISIVTPSYNQALYLERTILSVIEQGYPNLEYIVQDGGSEDGTKEILLRYSDKLTGWEVRLDEGQSQAINIGFVRTTGEIMAWLNSDDLLLPGAIAIVAAYFNRHPDVDVVYGNRLIINENDMEIGRWIMPGHDSAVLSRVDYVPQETMFWRRRIWDKVGGQIDESFRFAMDWDLLVRFRDAGAKFAHIPRFLGAFRVYAQQKTSAAINEIGHQEMDRIRERLLGKVPSYKEIRKAVFPFMLKHVRDDIIYRIKKKLWGGSQ